MPARGQGLLHLPQLGHDREGAGLQPLVAGGLVHQGAGGEVVAEAVAAQLDVRRLPAAVGLRRRRQPGVQAERVQEPVRVEAQQVGEAPLLRVAEGPLEDPHVAQGERLGRRRSRHRRGSVTGRARTGQQEGELHAALWAAATVGSGPECCVRKIQDLTRVAAGHTWAGNRSDHATARRVRAELLGGPRPGRDRRHRRRDPGDGRVHAPRRGPRRLHEPHGLHVRRRARGRGRGRSRRGARGPRPHRHADAEGRAPPRRGHGRVPVRPRVGRDDGRLRGPGQRASAGAPRPSWGSPSTSTATRRRPTTAGRSSRSGRGSTRPSRTGSGSRSGSPTTGRRSSCRSGARPARARATS